MAQATTVDGTVLIDTNLDEYQHQDAIFFDADGAQTWIRAYARYMFKWTAQGYREVKKTSDLIERDAQDCFAQILERATGENGELMFLSPLRRAGGKLLRPRHPRRVVTLSDYVERLVLRRAGRYSYRAGVRVPPSAWYKFSADSRCTFPNLAVFDARVRELAREALERNEILMQRLAEQEQAQ